jgi:hypothetical protein
MPTILCAKRSATAACWAGAPRERQTEACGRYVALTRPPAFGGTTLTELFTAQRVFGCISYEKALCGTTHRTTGVHPTLDSFLRSGTASECASTRNDGSRTSRRLAHDPPNGLAFSCRECAARDNPKKPTISRAKRSAAMPGWAVGFLAPHSLGFAHSILMPFPSRLGSHTSTRSPPDGG